MTFGLYRLGARIEVVEMETGNVLHAPSLEVARADLQREGLSPRKPSGADEVGAIEVWE